MEQKYIAIGIGVIVVLASIGVVLALVANPNDDDNDLQIPEISGKWNLSYVEIAKMSDDNEKPYTDPNQIVITDHHVNPFETTLSLEFDNVGKHSFTGKAYGEKERDIKGIINVSRIKFAVIEGDHSFRFEGSPKGEGYLSVSMSVVKRSTDTEDSVMCAMAYMLFVKDGEEPAPIRSDYFDMRVMEVGDHIKSTLHMMSDFTDNKNGRGTDVKDTLRFEKMHNMLSVFTLLNENKETIGIQVVASMGPTPSGTVNGNLVGNMKLTTAGNNWTFIGNVVIAHGKASFIHHLIPKSTNNPPTIVEFDYNVPYHKGGTLTPVYISEEHDYKGTVEITTANETRSNELSRKFVVYDNTFYSVKEVEGKKVEWFGEIYGHLIDLHVTVDGVAGHGRFSGHIDRDYNIHLFGILNDKATDEYIYVDITLELVK